MRTIKVIFIAVMVVLLAGVRLPVQAQQGTEWPTNGWRTSTPEEQGFDSGKLADGLQAARQQNLNIDSLLVIRNGSVLLDAYFYPYDGTTVHDLASVTKSFTTTLIAIAADQGKLRLDQPIVSFFPERTIANRDAWKEHITVRHLAGMVNGFESGCLSGDEPTLNAMRASPDWVQAALDRKMVREPGTSFCYDSPGMHLLSAILQKVTGMTELDFARQNLFGPLGIHDEIWDTDPQGFTHGWGDLHLQPRDAAKLGYLWLNDGVWDGKQIASAAWVKDAVKVQSKTGVSDDYGYGWWVSSDSYSAQGRGGQRVEINPSLNAVVVVTGDGVDFDQVVSFLRAAFIDPNKPLPANPAGVAKLKATLASLVQPPAPQPVGSLPDIAKTISGKTYLFASNPAQVETISLEFNDSAQAILHLKMSGSDQMMSWPIGLDGIYRLSPGDDNLPQGLRGSWADPQTFVFEIDGIANIEHATYRLHFEGDRLVIDSPELGLRLEGKLERP